MTDFVDTSSLTGSRNEARCSLATLVVIVAENKYVCRLSLGITLRILSMTGPKSRSSNLSASSMTCVWKSISQLQPRARDHACQGLTKYLSPLKLNPFVFSKWSCSRPGVATITCGFFASATC